MMTEVLAKQILKEMHTRAGMELPFTVEMIGVSASSVNMPPERNRVIYLVSQQADKWEVAELAWRAHLGYRYHYLLATYYFAKKTPEDAARIFATTTMPVAMAWSLKEFAPYLKKDELKRYYDSIKKSFKALMGLAKRRKMLAAELMSLVVGFAATLVVLKKLGFKVKFSFDADPVMANWIQKAAEYIDRTPSPSQLADFFNTITPTPIRASIIEEDGIEVFKLTVEAPSSLP